MNMLDKYICAYKPLEIVIVIKKLLPRAKVSQTEYRGATFSPQTFCVIMISQYNIAKNEIEGFFFVLGGNSH